MDAHREEHTRILSIAAAQGVALLVLHESVRALDSPPQWFWLLWPLYAWVVWLVPLLQLLVAYWRDKALWQVLAGFAAVFAAMAGYKGWAAWVPGRHGTSDWTADAAVLGVCATAFAFILLPFIQQRLRLVRWGADYPSLFADSWRNALRLCSAAGFAAAFWLLLGLCAALFKILNVAFFADLFTHPRFVYPASALMFGLGLSLYQMREAAILGIYRASLNLLGWLLPLAAALAVGFLAALPFTGLQPLWKTGHATALMLGLQGAMLFLFNAAWQDGTGEPLPPRWLRRPLGFAVASLPVYAGLCAYALGLRVGQHGWSGERVWAALLVFVFSLYGLGYAIAALRQSAVWMSGVDKVNTAVALAVAVLLAATATPLLDPDRIGVASQVARLLSGQTLAESFDYQYLRFETGRLGAEALERLAKLDKHPQASVIREKALAVQKQAYKIWHPEKTRPDVWTADEIKTRLRFYPAGTRADESFFPVFAARANARGVSMHCLRPDGVCDVVAMDLDGDGAVEYAVVYSEYELEIFQHGKGGWESAGFLHPIPGIEYKREEIGPALAQGRFKTLPPRWPDLDIAGRRYGFERYHE